MAVADTPATRTRLTVDGMTVTVTRKNIRNLHLAVHPPAGRITVSAPLATTDDNVRLAVVSRLQWIKKQQREFEAQPRQSARQYVSGECHYVFGQRCRLRLIEHGLTTRIELHRSSRLELHVPPGLSVEQRGRMLDNWYRRKLKARIPPLLEKWHPVVGREAADWGVKKMKTKWGSCNPDHRRIWLNLELAKKHPRCLEYIVVHELTHFHERHHNDRFRAFMDSYLPDWRDRRKLLNRSPLAHADWQY